MNTTWDKTMTGEGGLPGITDIHIHLEPVDRLRPGFREAALAGNEHCAALIARALAEPTALLAHLDREGIDRAGVILYPSPEVVGLGEEINEDALRLAAADRERLLVFGGLLPTRSARGVERAVDRLVDGGLAGLKIHPSHQYLPANAHADGCEGLGAIYRQCQERGMPVMIHTGTSIFPRARNRFGHPMEIDDVAVDFPELRIIMAHGGRPLWCEEAFFIMRRHRNVWLDISGIPPARLLTWFPRLSEIGDRVLWGTDWPSPGVRGMRINLQQLRQLALPPSLERQITRTNSLSLFPRQREAPRGSEAGTAGELNPARPPS